MDVLLISITLCSDCTFSVTFCKNRMEKIVMRIPIASINYSQHLLTALTA